MAYQMRQIHISLDLSRVSIYVQMTFRCNVWLILSHPPEKNTAVTFDKKYQRFTVYKN